MKKGIKRLKMGITQINLTQTGEQIEVLLRFQGLLLDIGGKGTLIIRITKRKPPGHYSRGVVEEKKRKIKVIPVCGTGTN